MNNRRSGLAIGSLQLGNLANLNNDGQLVLKQGASLANHASSGSVVASSVGGNFVQGSSGSLDA